MNEITARLTRSRVVRKGMPDIEPSSHGCKELHFGPEPPDDEGGISTSASPRPESASPETPVNNLDHHTCSSASEPAAHLGPLHSYPGRCDNNTDPIALSTSSEIVSSPSTDDGEKSSSTSCSWRSSDEEIDRVLRSVIDLMSLATLLGETAVGWEGWEGCSVGLELEEILRTYLYGDSSWIDLGE